MGVLGEYQESEKVRRREKRRSIPGTASSWKVPDDGASAESAWLVHVFALRLSGTPAEGEVDAKGG